MDDEFRWDASAPPSSVVIQNSAPENTQSMPFNQPTLTGQPTNFQNMGVPQQGYQIPIAVKGKPSLMILGASLLIILFSTVFPFLTIDSVFGDGDLICFLLCNGNAIGLILMGVYCMQYGTWERNSGKNVSMAFSYIIGIVVFFLAAVLVFLWAIYAEDSYF